MKLRMGFVSNSSSSSFLIIGRELKKEGVEKALLDSEVVAIGEGMGTSGEAEDYVLLLTPQRWEILKDTEISDSMLFVRVSYSSMIDGSLKIPASKGEQTWFVRRDYSSPSTTDEFKDWIKHRV